MNFIKHLIDAYDLARMSPDPSNQCGAVLLKRRKNGSLYQIAEGYNHFYDGIEPEVSDRNKKLQRIEHAERDCIYYATKYGRTTMGGILVCPWVACYDCARAIIGSRIDIVVYHHERYQLTPERWLDSINESLNWMRNSGILLLGVKGPINAEPILVNGQLWSPKDLKFME